MAARLTPQERHWRSISEKAHQQSLINLAERCGWRVCHFSDSRRQVREGVFVGDAQAAGFPDLVLVRPPELVFIECKKELGKTSPEQDGWIADLRECGFDVYVSRPSNFDLVAGRLKRPRVKLS